MCWGVKGMDYLCNEDPDVEGTSEVKEESACVPTANYFRLVFLGGPLWVVCYEFLLNTKETVTGLPR